MPTIRLSSGQEIEYFYPESFDDSEDKLATLKAFKRTLYEHYPPSCTNLTQRIKVLDALMFIKANLDGYIAYAVSHQDDRSVHLGGARDKSKNVLRCHNDISFHIIPHCDNPTDEERARVRHENIFKLNWLVSEIEGAFTFLNEHPDSHDVMQSFINKINPAEAGCLDGRFSEALKFFLLLKEGNNPRLDDLIESALNKAKDEAHIAKDNTQHIILFVLSELEEYLDTKVTWSIDQHAEPFKLTRDTIKQYFQQLLAYSEDDWKLCAKTIINHRTTSHGRHGLIVFVFDSKQAWMATGFRSFAETCLPPEEITEMKRGSIHQLRDGTITINFSRNQLGIIRSLVANPGALKTLDSIIDASQKGSKFDTLLSILHETKPLLGESIKVGDTTKSLSVKDIYDYTIKKGLFSEHDWHQLGTELKNEKRRQTPRGLVEYIFSKENQWRAIGMHQLATMLLPQMKRQLQRGTPREIIIQGIYQKRSVRLPAIGLILSPEQVQLLEVISESSMQVDHALSSNPHGLLKRKETDKDDDEDKEIQKRSRKTPAAAASSSAV